MKYEIEYKSHTTVEAANLDEAKKKFIKNNPIPAVPVHFTEINGSIIGKTFDCIGNCEISELPIFEHDNYKSDQNGVMWLTEYE